MEQTIKKNIAQEMNWKFLLLFLLYLVLFSALAQVMLPVMYEGARLLTSFIAGFWRLLQFPVINGDTFIVFYDFNMEINAECTGFHYMVIFLSAVLAYPGHTWLYKAAGIAAGITAILIINTVRIGVLGLVGHYYHRFFPVVHTFLWEGFFTFVVLLLWILWVNGRKMVSAWLLKQVAVGAAVVVLSFFAVSFLLNYYIFCMAFISEGIFKILALFVTVPDAVISQDDLLGYRYADDVVYSKTGSYFVDLGVYIGVAVVMGIYLRRYSIREFLCGLMVMVAAHILIITLDWSFLHATEPALRAALTAVIVLVAVTAPLVSWLLPRLLFYRGIPEGPV